MSISETVILVGRGLGVRIRQDMALQSFHALDQKEWLLTALHTYMRMEV
jgi:hypothetical protein